MNWRLFFQFNRLYNYCVCDNCKEKRGITIMHLLHHAASIITAIAALFVREPRYVLATSTDLILYVSNRIVGERR
jgi:hypothetical protein